MAHLQRYFGLFFSDIVVYPTVNLRHPNRGPSAVSLQGTSSDVSTQSYEPRYEKSDFLHMRKQRRRSASRIPRSLSAHLFSLHLFYLNSKFQASSHLCGCTAWFVLDLVGSPEDLFSHNEAHIHCTLTVTSLLQFTYFSTSVYLF